MKTIVLSKPGEFALIQTDPPAQPASDEALVRVRRIGICGTDLHAFRGRQPFFTYPRILGHELGVEVEAIGEGVTNVQVGDLCAVEPYLNCGHCIACRKGKTNCCVSLQVLGVHTDGGMREHILVPAHKLHSSKTLSLDQLALIEMLGIGAHAVERAQVQPGEFALVIGAGPIGLATIQFAVAAGAQVIALDVNRERLEFSHQLGVQHTVVAGEDTLADLNALTQGDLPTLVFDATGSPSSMQRSFEYVAAGGKLIFVGLVQSDITFSDPHFHRREITLYATRNATAATFRQIIGLMESGAIDTTPWITHRAPLTGMIPHFSHWLEPETKVIKAIIEID